MGVFLGGARATFQNNHVISWQITAAVTKKWHYELHFIAYSTRNRCINGIK